MNRAASEVVARNLGIHVKDVIEVSCIQQKQSFECGIHVLANTKYIADHYCKGNKINLPFIEWINE